MYRSNFEGLTQQIRSLEEQKLHLEADLVGVGRMRGPQRVLRWAIGALLLVGVAVCGAALGYRHATVEYRRAAAELGEDSRKDAKAALERIELCNERCPSQRSAGSMGF